MFGWNKEKKGTHSYSKGDYILSGTEYTTGTIFKGPRLFSLDYSKAESTGRADHVISVRDGKMYIKTTCMNDLVHWILNTTPRLTSVDGKPYKLEIEGLEEDCDGKIYLILSMKSIDMAGFLPCLVLGEDMKHEYGVVAKQFEGEN